MPEVMLPRDWPNRFRRTVDIKGKRRVMEFHPGVPIDLKTAEIEALDLDIGVSLMPVMRDAKGKVRIVQDADAHSTREALDVAQVTG